LGPKIENRIKKLHEVVKEQKSNRIFQKYQSNRWEPEVVRRLSEVSKTILHLRIGIITKKLE